MMRSLALIAALALAAPAAAQDQSLADVRNELAQLSAQLQSLRSELVASGAQGMQAAGGASALQRMDTMEASLMRLTSRTEELQNRVDRVVKDGTNRIGDLEFRLCEATPGCDIGSVGQTLTSLRPMGEAEFAGEAGQTRVIQARSEFGSLEPRTPVVVVHFHDGVATVRPSTPAEHAV